jgi:hypothetical protein
MRNMYSSHHATAQHTKGIFVLCAMRVHKEGGRGEQWSWTRRFHLPTRAHNTQPRIGRIGASTSPRIRTVLRAWILIVSWLLAADLVGIVPGLVRFQIGRLCS